MLPRRCPTCWYPIKASSPDLGFLFGRKQRDRARALGSSCKSIDGGPIYLIALKKKVREAQCSDRGPTARHDTTLHYTSRLLASYPLSCHTLGTAVGRIFLALSQIATNNDNRIQLRPHTDTVVPAAARYPDSVRQRDGCCLPADDYPPQIPCLSADGESLRRASGWAASVPVAGGEGETGQGASSHIREHSKTFAEIHNTNNNNDMGK